MKKTLREMAVKWHESGLNVAQISKLMPQCNPEEIKVAIENHEKEERNEQ